MLQKHNIDLNSSLVHKAAFQRWDLYRKTLTDYVIGFKGESLMVVGAGNCNDIDLGCLEASFSSVLLTDIDLASMEKACKLQKSEASVQRIDYLGLEEKPILKAIQSSMTDEGIGRLESLLQEMVVTIGLGKDIWVQGQYDRVLVLPIYTQLLFGQLNQMLDRAFKLNLISGQTYHVAQRRCLDIMPNVIHLFNESLNRQVKKGGKLIVLSDYLEDKPDGYYATNFDPNSFEGIYKNYVDAYGMGLGHFGHYDLEQAYPSSHHQWFLWPFDRDRHLLVKGAVFDF